MNAVLNGQRRPNLNEQINRLDRILDGLAEGLNESVASAAQVAVHAAVKEATETVLRELFTGAAVMPALAAAMSPPTAPLIPKPSVSTRFGHACRWLWRTTIAVIKALPATARRIPAAFLTGFRRVAGAARRLTVNQVTRTAASVAGLFVLAWRLRRSIPMALTVGVGAATLGYCSTPELVALLHGLTVATLAIMVRMMSPMRRARPATTT
jgi:hypothetical protein